MVAGHLCPQFLLESRTGFLHAPSVRKGAALLVVRQFPGPRARSSCGVAQIPGADDHPCGLERAGYVRAHRMKWEQSWDASLKEDLIRYNLEDCRALEAVTPRGGASP